MSQDAITPLDTTVPAEQARVRELTASINLDDPALTLTYGAETMNGISRFADDLLGRVRAKDAGPVGDTLTDLLVKVKDADLSAISDGRQGFLERLPVVGSLFSSARRSVAKFDTLAGQVEDIAARLDESMVGLLRDIEVLEQLYKHNRDFHNDLSVYIEAGKARLDQAREQELPRLQEEAAKSGDNMDAQKVRDFADKLNRFERRLHDLQLSRTITVQTAPQIRLIQSNDQTLAEKIQTSILTTIPIWKSQMVLALSLHGQKGAARLQKEVADTTNALLRQNAEMLETASVDTAREVERSVVDVETLRDVQQRLVSTIEQTLQIAEDGRTKRLSVEKELQNMEQELRDQLSSLASRKSAQAIVQAQGTPAIEASSDTSAEASREADPGKP